MCDLDHFLSSLKDVAAHIWAAAIAATSGAHRHAAAPGVSNSLFQQQAASVDLIRQGREQDKPEGVELPGLPPHMPAAARAAASAAAMLLDVAEERCAAAAAALGLSSASLPAVKGNAAASASTAAANAALLHAVVQRRRQLQQGQASTPAAKEQQQQQQHVQEAGIVPCLETPTPPVVPAAGVACQQPSPPSDSPSSELSAAERSWRTLAVALEPKLEELFLEQTRSGSLMPGGREAAGSPGTRQEQRCCALGINATAQRVAALLMAWSAANGSEQGAARGASLPALLARHIFTFPTWAPPAGARAAAAVPTASLDVQGAATAVVTALRQHLH